MTARRFQPDFAALDPGDQRCALRRITLKDGLTLRQAMLFYGDQTDATGFLRYDPRFRSDARNGQSPRDLRYSITGSGYLHARERLQRLLLSKLATGELHAVGYASNRGIDEAAQPIPSDRWRTLQADFDTSQASSPGLEISGVLVFERGRSSGRTQKRPVASQAKVRAWYKKRLREAEEAGLQHSREADEIAARLHFGFAPRQFLRDLRRELAPQDWKSSGRPRARE